MLAYKPRPGDFKVVYEMNESSLFAYNVYQLQAGEWEWISAMRYPGYISTWLSGSKLTRVGMLLTGGDIPQGYYRNTSTVERERDAELQRQLDTP